VSLHPLEGAGHETASFPMLIVFILSALFFLIKLGTTLPVHKLISFFIITSLISWRIAAVGNRSRYARYIIIK